MFGDAVRDIVTNLRGTFEMLENVASQLRTPDAKRVDRDMNGKVCIVTGGNTGIGRGTSQALVARGARVILACIDKEHALEAAQALQAVPRLQGCQKHSVEVAQLDLASLSSVKSFAADFNARGLPLDVLVCNAGIMAPPVRRETEDGLEQQFQVNYLGHWLLTHQLLAGQRDLRAKQKPARPSKEGIIVQSPAAQRRRHFKHTSRQQQLPGPGAAQQAVSDGTRVVLLSSMTHRAGRIQFDDLHARKSYNAFRRYADSKLALLLAVRAFAQRMQGANQKERARDTVVAVHPGLIQTALAKQWIQNESPIRVFKGLTDVMYHHTFLPPAYAVETVMHAITAPADEVHGKYIERSRAVKPSRLAVDDSTASQLWNISCHLTGITD